MKWRLLSLLSFGLCAIKTAAASSRSSDSLASDFDYSELSAGPYLVELEDGTSPEGFFEGLEIAGFKFKRRLSMASKVFNGASFRVLGTPSSGHISMNRLASRLKVRHTWPIVEKNTTEPRASPFAVKKSSASSLKVKRSSDTSSGYGPHAMTQIDKLHAAGYTGKGKRIGIIDSGVDYNHPVLGGCFGKGCKVSYGWDVAGDNYTPGADPEPDDDPYEHISYHGTHVAGIIGASKNALGFLGAAPDAELGMFKIVGNNGQFTTDDIIIAAMVMAFDQGSDVISMSWGSIQSWSSHPMALVASRIVAQGVPFVVAAGNSGEAGPWGISVPSSGPGVISVGMTDSIDVPFLLLEGTWTSNDGSPKSFGWANMDPPIQSDLTLPLYAVDSMTPGSIACDALPEYMDLSGKFALVQFIPNYHECNPLTQISHLVDRGAKNVIMFTTHNETIPDMGFTFPGLSGFVKIPPSSASLWIDALNDGANVTVTMPGSSVTEASYYLEMAKNEKSAGAMNGASSWGPTWDMKLKPDVSAPGADILSTTPLDHGGYAVLTGTSMAAPLVAGLTALLMEWSDFLAPVAQQGAGLVQGWKSASVSTTLSISSFSLNDTDNFAGDLVFSIFNGGDKEVTYALSHVESISLNTFNNATMWPQLQPAEVLSDAATIRFNAKKVTVPAGHSVEVSVTGSGPSNLDADLLPMYGGYVKVTGSNSETLTLPYIGLYGSLRSTEAILPPPEGMTFLADPEDQWTPAAANATFEIERPASLDDGPRYGDPMVSITLRVGTPILRAYVVAFDKKSLTSTKFFDYEVVGSLYGFPYEWIGRTQPYSGANNEPTWIPDTFEFWGVLSDGTIVPEGRYQIVVSTLRIFGDAGEREDWDFVETVPFNLKYISSPSNRTRLH